MDLFNLHSIALNIKEGPFLGLDWGKKYVGLAISDKDNGVAMPLSVVNSGGALRHCLVNLWKEYQIQALVIGWPLHFSGERSTLCSPIENLAIRLSKDHGWPITLWDERLTSQAALKVCSSASGKRYDHHAACILLQGALNRWRSIREEENLV